MDGKDTITVVNLTGDERGELEELLALYDRAHIGYAMDGSASVGVHVGGKLVAGADGCMTAFRIFYISTVYVDAAHRGHGFGRAVMAEIEKRARTLGADRVRLDTFDFQGKGFYEAIGYECVGEYDCGNGHTEHFFVKRLEWAEKIK